MENWINKLQYPHNEIIEHTIDKCMITLMRNWQI